MILGYCRVSTSHREQDASIEAQERQLLAAGCSRVIKERRSAYKAGKRPGWEGCKGLITSGKIEKFMVVSLSRASRRQETAEMSELCNEHGVEFIALTGGPVDVSTPEGLLNVGIQDTVNRFDSLLKGVRVKQGMEARRAAGATAVGKCPYGYRYNGTCPVPDSKTWNKAKQLWQELSAEEFIANQVLRSGKWKFSNSGLIRWMRNPILMGRTRYSEHKVEPLVSPEEWARCQRMLDNRRRTYARSSPTTRLFTRMVKCCTCGRCLNYTRGGTKFYLKCMFPKCLVYGRAIREELVRAQVIEALRTSAPEKLAEATSQIEAPPVKTAEDLAREAQLQSLLMMQSQGVEGLELAIKRLRPKVTPPTCAAPDWRRFTQLFALPGVLESATDPELRELLLEFIDEIIYVGNPREVTIRVR